jgi:hypothetical protein
MRRISLTCSLLLLSILIIGMNKAANILETDKFSTNIPDGWIVQKEDASKVVIIMPDAKNEEVFISIAASSTNSALSIDEAWAKIKPSVVKNKKITYDGEEIIHNEKWKKLEMREIVCEKEINKIILFTLRNSTKYLIQFGCPIDKLEWMMPFYASVMHSIKFK